MPEEKKREIKLSLELIAKIRSVLAEIKEKTGIEISVNEFVQKSLNKFINVIDTGDFDDAYKEFSKIDKEISKEAFIKLLIEEFRRIN